MGAGRNGVRLFRHRLRLAQREYRTARVGQHAVDGVVAGKDLKDGSGAWRQAR